MKKFIPAALLSFLNRCWQLLLVLILLLVLLSINLDKVRWFSNNPPPTGLIWLGAVLGAVVAFSRFSNLSCQLYLLLSGLLAVLQTSHGLLSGMNDLAGMNFWSFSDSIRLHLHLFYLQFISGWQGSFHGYLVLCLLFWICGAWLVWATIRIKRPLAGIIPAACMLGYESNLKNHNLGTMAIFVFFAVLLASAASFREQHDDWEKRNISTPWELGDWPFSALVIAALAATFTLTIPYVATQEGRREISDFLKPEPQKIQISNYSVYQPETSGEQITITDFDLQDPGKPPSRSTAAVMLLRLNDPPPVESGPEIWNDANQRYYLRSSLFTTYTGSGWKIEEVQEKPALEEAGPGRRLLVQEIEILVNHEGRLFAANLPISSGQGTYLSAATPDGSPLLSGQGNTYTVQFAGQRPAKRRIGKSRQRLSASNPANLPAASARPAGNHLSAGRRDHPQCTHPAAENPGCSEFFAEGISLRPGYPAAGRRTGYGGIFFVSRKKRFLHLLRQRHGGSSAQQRGTCPSGCRLHCLAV